MIKLILHDKKGKLEIKLGRGKRHILTKNDFKTWEKIEIREVEDEKEDNIPGVQK